MQLWPAVRALEEGLREGAAVSVEPDDGFMDITFTTAAGWRFNIFFDCGCPDFVNWVESPAGERFVHRVDDDHALGYVLSQVILHPPLLARLKGLMVGYPGWPYLLPDIDETSLYGTASGSSGR